MIDIVEMANRKDYKFLETLNPEDTTKSQLERVVAKFAIPYAGSMSKEKTILAIRRVLKEGKVIRYNREYRVINHLLGSSSVRNDKCPNYMSTTIEDVIE